MQSRDKGTGWLSASSSSRGLAAASPHVPLISGIQYLPHVASARSAWVPAVCKVQSQGPLHRALTHCPRLAAGWRNRKLRALAFSGTVADKSE